MAITESPTVALPGRDAYGQCVTYGPHGMPDVMVLVDTAGQRSWCPGRVRMQVQLDNAGWVFTVDYFVAGRVETDRFPAQRVRGDAVAQFVAAGRPAR